MMVHASEETIATRDAKLDCKLSSPHTVSAEWCWCSLSLERFAVDTLSLLGSVKLLV
jgi:hypothetical protein